MKIAPFEMERWQSLHEHHVSCNLSDSGVHPLSLAELGAVFEDDSWQGDLLAQPLEYTQTNGTVPLRERIAALYPGATPDNIEVTTGGVEANCIAAWTLIEPGDEVVCLTPNYGQLPGLVEGLGAKVVPWNMEPDWEANRWRVDPEALAALVGPKTRMILLCNPSNPTGGILDGEVLDAVCAIAAKHGTWVLADEIYSGSEIDGSDTPTIWGRGERVIVTNSLSKAYGLPGLRLGWIVSDESSIDAFWTRHDYTTIGPSAMSDHLATRVLEPAVRARLFARTRDWLTTNWALVSAWLAERPQLRTIAPQAGAMAWIQGGAEDTAQVAERLRVQDSLLLVPGEQFGSPGWLRIGFGATPEKLSAGLERLGRIEGFQPSSPPG